MKKILILLIFSASISHAYAQKSEILECGTDELMRKHYERFPEQKARIDAFNLELSKRIKSGKPAAQFSKNQPYEIPVVIHVISDGSALGTANNKSDADIIAWINYTNGVFAGNASSGMSTSSAVLPIKLVFAKVDPNCNPTNGINRINASQLTKYVNGGVNTENTTNTVNPPEIVALGMWNTSQYYNIYVVNKLYANSSQLNGFAYFPGGSLDYSFMSAHAAAVNVQTLAHEFGHALGLYHTFEGSTSSNPCPTNTECTLQGDLVCDTEPSKNLLTLTCQTGQINSCTGNAYAGEERNIMAYTRCTRDMFTQGQKDRAMAQLLQYRASLFNSPVGNPSPINNNVSLTTACKPTTITNPGNFDIGITSVKFGNINNYSLSYKTAENNFYENFTGNYCSGISKTNIPLNSATTLTVAPGTSNSHTIKAYIDYNNDGQFNETTELVLNKSNISNGSFATASVTPPSNAVTNVPLRMRVIGDSGAAITSCYTPKYGQAEDYSVTITSVNNLITKEIKRNKTNILKVEDSVLVESDVKISSLNIYDASGRLLLNQSNIKATEFSAPVTTRNTIIIVKATLENGKVITKKLQF